MNTADAKRVLETALICAQQPLPVREMRVLFNDELGADTIKTLLHDLQNDWARRGVESRPAPMKSPAPSSYGRSTRSAWSILALSCTIIPKNSWHSGAPIASLAASRVVSEI